MADVKPGPLQVFRDALYFRVEMYRAASPDFRSSTRENIIADTLSEVVEALDKILKLPQATPPGE